MSNRRTNVDALGHAHAPAGPGARIVSLVPSLTELIFDLGLGERLVGRTGFCIHPRDALRAVPKVGGTKDVKVDVLKALAPTHLIVNIDENRKETVDELAAFVPHVIVTHPCTPADNLQLYRLFGSVFDCEAAAERLCTALQSALDDAAALRAGLADEAVLYLIWRQPWMTVARGTYIAAMLETVGWRTLPEEAQTRYPVFEWPLAEQAGRVFLSSEPYRFKESHLAEVEALGKRPATLIDGEMVSWYGSRAVAGLRYLIALRRRLAGLVADQRSGAAAGASVSALKRSGVITR
ncbi:helical backbone metal receptor [Thauera butanivorans]|jgi:ABC-type Fe3+-hydroxamate transport system substrate-binding protein|uniref:helical backbone metal receptor n=1 Tax=Thauera butanivorans TaxID=86174 RepID=UPI000A06B0A4|nr:helical backbone metal receptor [Thauera butanivorans]